jgi:hypothetical protein
LSSIRINDILQLQYNWSKMKIRCAFNQSKPLFLVLLKGMVGWKWEEEELCSSLVKRLKKGEALDTRTFLRPVFKYVCYQASTHLTR